MHVMSFLLYKTYVQPQSWKWMTHCFRYEKQLIQLETLCMKDKHYLLWLKGRYYCNKNITEYTNFMLWGLPWADNSYSDGPEIFGYGTQRLITTTKKIYQRTLHWAHSTGFTYSKVILQILILLFPHVCLVLTSILTKAVFICTPSMSTHPSLPYSNKCTTV